MENETKQCQHCAKKMQGRTDKKFCSNYCRSSYHNALYGNRTNYMRRINALLLRNRKILSDLFVLQRKGAHVPLSELYMKGFTPQHFTHQAKHTSKTVYTFCYEFGYSFVGKDAVRIVQEANTEFSLL